MSETTHIFETIGLRVERRAGWLSNVTAAIDGFGYRLESFVLRGSAGAHPMDLTLTLRATDADARRDALVLALRRLPGVRPRSGLQRVTPPVAQAAQNLVA